MVLEGWVPHALCTHAVINQSRMASTSNRPASATFCLQACELLIAIAQTTHKWDVSLNSVSESFICHDSRSRARSKMYHI